MGEAWEENCFTFVSLVAKHKPTPHTNRWRAAFGCLPAKAKKTSHSVIGRYERDEMSPSIDAVKKMAAILDTTVGYLLGESNEGKTLKDTAMLKRLNDISALPDKDKEHILYTIDGLIKSAKLQAL